MIDKESTEEAKGGRVRVCERMNPFLMCINKNYPSCWVGTCNHVSKKKKRKGVEKYSLIPYKLGIRSLLLFLL